MYCLSINPKAFPIDSKLFNLFRSKNLNSLSRKIGNTKDRSAILLVNLIIRKKKVNHGTYFIFDLDY